MKKVIKVITEVIATLIFGIIFFVGIICSDKYENSFNSLNTFELIFGGISYWIEQISCYVIWPILYLMIHLLQQMVFS